MMNAADWQATAEWLGFIWLVSNAIVWGLFYRAQAAFVTRAEHNAVEKRIDAVELDVNEMKVGIAKLMTAEQAAALVGRQGVLETQGAKMLGEMGGIQDQLTAANNLLQMLVQNELRGGAKA
jgi:hypothetical protein